MDGTTSAPAPIACTLDASDFKDRVAGIADLNHDALLSSRSDDLRARRRPTRRDRPGGRARRGRAGVRAIPVEERRRFHRAVRLQVGLRPVNTDTTTHGGRGHNRIQSP